MSSLSPVPREYAKEEMAMWIADIREGKPPTEGNGIQRKPFETT